MHASLYTLPIVSFNTPNYHILVTKFSGKYTKLAILLIYQSMHVIR